MQFNWQEFVERAPKRRGGEIHVTINKIGRIFLNKHAIAALGNPDGVMLMYDERRRAIGICGTPMSREGAYLLWDKSGDPSKRNHSRVISAKDFCKRFGIAPTETLAFPKPQIADGVLVLELNEARSAAKG